MKKADLRAEEPPDTTPLTGISPAQNTNKHECKKENVRNKGGKDADFVLLCIPNTTQIASPVPDRCGCA
jgi:hypothetical protein